MSDLPSGTVTFLFTDIEGSTNLLHELGAEAYDDALVEHRDALRQAFLRHGGVEVDTQGDAFFYAFPTAPQALEAAMSGQEALAAGPIRVRIGLHTGRPHIGKEGYVGDDVHLGARIAASAHGGQIVLSRATEALLEDAFPLADLGEHQLKDFSKPIRMYQLGADRFPPLKTISNSNLPRPVSSFVGREREVSEVVSLLRNGARLVTLSGPGGSGKTRLAIEAASDLVPEYRNGVFWIGLSPLRDATLVTESIAQTLGAKNGLTEHIGERELLLLLDNIEQVIGVAQELAVLLQACPNLRLLVTSRELLRISGEREYPVPPLASPEAVELFCQRSRLEPSEQIAELCSRLDDLPLAVELAAARASVLSPAQILERLSQRLDLLKGGRDAEARQQTLRATIEWSYELLSAEERHLLARLAVFSGGCTLDAAEEVAAAELDTLQMLVEKSLVRHTNDRFWMLETIREYANERLAASEKEPLVRSSHARWFLRLSEEADTQLAGPAQGEWLNVLEVDQDNLRAALSWSTTNDGDTALRLVGALWRFWNIRGNQREGFSWCERALATGGSGLMRANALLGASYLGVRVGEIPRAQETAQEALTIFRGEGDIAGAARAARDVANALTAVRDFEGSWTLLEESRALSLKAGDEWNLAIAISNLGYVALCMGDAEKGQRLCDEAVTLRRALGDKRGLALSLANRSYAELEQKNTESAAAGFEESLSIGLEIGFREGMTDGLLGLSALAFEHGETERAATLMGAVQACMEASGISTFFSPHEHDLRDHVLGACRERLGEAGFDRAYERGSCLSLEEATAYALGTSEIAMTRQVEGAADDL